MVFCVFTSGPSKKSKDSGFGTTPPAEKSAQFRLFEVTEDLDNPELAFWGGVATGTIFVSLLICLKHLGGFFWQLWIF